ncbi:MAG TPA: ArsA-related P-loop ATPase [Acidimicrobiales bacterium]|nr:ArsA-related P-loop ATPase [Acidimicrobiales bacterium]
MARAPARRSSGSLEQLLAAKEIAICCGAGGVGKTTVAAAAATMASLSLGGTVLVLTVDPARRLADALGLEALGNVETRVSSEALKKAGVEPRGDLWAAMLDTKQEWDDLVRRHAPDARTARRILENPLYQNISARFVQSHEYIAMERLYDLHRSGRYDLIVVDTPPTRHAIDFLAAPDRMADFFSSRLLRWLTGPARSRMLNLATRPFYQVADRILGSQFLEDIAEFFLLFQTMYPGFAERARAVKHLLHDRRTTFLVVTTLEAAPVREAEFFLSALAAQGFHAGALVLNKVLPPYLLDPSAAEVAERLAAEAPALADALPEAGPPQAVSRVLREVAESFLNFQVVAKREAELRAELAASAEVVVSIPSFDTDIYDVSGLVQVGRAVWSG